MKRAELSDVARGLRSIADSIEVDFTDDEVDDEAERQTAVLVFRAQASALASLG